LPLRPEVADLTISPDDSVSYPTRDGAQVPGYITYPPGGVTKNLPAIILPHGGPGARDAQGFDWLSQFFAQLGYVVLQPNFRGSTGYGETWYGKNGFKAWETAMGDINDGAHWLVAKGIADPKRLAIFGWSYGGYAALQANVLEPDLYKAAIAVAPVTDLNALKSDALRFSNYKIEAAFLGTGPHLTQGSPANNAKRFKVPVLLFHGDQDLNVDIQQSRIMDSALSSAGVEHQLIVYKGLDHSLIDSRIRADLLTRSAEFLTKAMGTPN
jgi:dipeptidyl aminopeptidase/acylaminoacyl peptidase